MSTTIEQPIDAQHEDGGGMLMAIEPELLCFGNAFPIDDAYADCELRTRHERTERMIRKAKEQA